MAKQATTEQYDQAWAMHQAGATNGQIQEATGLNYSQMWLDRTRRELEQGNDTVGGWIATHDPKTKAPLPNTVIGAAIVKARAADQSWGLIAVRTRMPESRVRTVFTEVSALDSRGLRIGHGGRWVQDDPRFYTGAERAKVGTELDPKVPVAQQVPTGDAPVRTLPTIAQRVGAPAPAKRVRKATKKA